MKSLERNRILVIMYLPHSDFLTPQPPHFEQKDDELLAIAEGTYAEN